MNAGKRFEERFRRSVPEGAFCMRIADKVYRRGDFTGSEESEADFLCSMGNNSFLVECKATASKSLSYDNVKEHQEKSLMEFDSQGCNEHGLLAVEFYDKNGYKKGSRRMFLLPISCWMDYKASSGRKSMPISAFEALGREAEDLGGRYDVPFFAKKLSEGLYRCFECSKCALPEEDLLPNADCIGFCAEYGSFVRLDDSVECGFFRWR